MSAPDFPVVIHHNPDCGTSRNVVAMVRAAGYEPEIVEYLKTGWTRSKLDAFLAAIPATPRDLLREKGTPAAALGLTDPAASDEAILEAMLAHPILVNRPIVVTPKGTRLCRPSEAVLDLLDRRPDSFTKEDGEVVRRLTARPARLEDAAAITEIYNQGIEDRIATFETEPRVVAQIEAWFGSAIAIEAVEDAGGEVVGYAVAHPYSDRCCYQGVGEFSVYVRRSARGQGVGQVAMAALIAAAEQAGLWKLLSRVFPENRASLALMARMGFEAIGVHRNHGKLDGAWRDNVIVERLIPANIG